MNIYEELRERIDRNLKGKRFLKAEIGPDIRSDDIVFLKFNKNHMLKINVPRGHTVKDLNIQVSDGNGWVK